MNCKTWSCKPDPRNSTAVIGMTPATTIILQVAPASAPKCSLHLAREAGVLRLAGSTPPRSRLGRREVSMKQTLVLFREKRSMGDRWLRKRQILGKRWSLDI